MTIRNIRKRSFTLIEMLVAMGLLSILVYAMVSLLDQTQKAMSAGVGQMEVTEDAQFVMDRIARDVQNRIPLSKRAAWTSNRTTAVDVADENTLVIITTRIKKKAEYCKVTYQWESAYTDKALDGIGDATSKKTYNVLTETVDYLDSKDGSSLKTEESIIATGVIDTTGAGAGFYVKDEIKSKQRLIVTLSMIDRATKNIGYATLNDQKQDKITAKRYNVKTDNGTVNLLNTRLKRFSRIFYVTEDTAE